MQSNPPSELEIFKHADDKNSYYLVVKILENGDLSMEGQDIGETPKKAWGEDEYEYFVKVPAKYKDFLLLWLIKEKFGGGKPSSDFMECLKTHNIPYNFFSRP